MFFFIEDSNSALITNKNKNYLKKTLIYIYIIDKNYNI